MYQTLEEISVISVILLESVCRRMLMIDQFQANAAIINVIGQDVSKRCTQKN